MDKIASTIYRLIDKMPRPACHGAFRLPIAASKNTQKKKEKWAYVKDER